VWGAAHHFSRLKQTVSVALWHTALDDNPNAYHTKQHKVDNKIVGGEGGDPAYIPVVWMLGKIVAIGNTKDNGKKHPRQSILVSEAKGMFAPMVIRRGQGT
jgi:hypothetical protein